MEFAAGDISTGTLGGLEGVEIWSLFLQADLVVKLVLLGLALASVWCWAVVAHKHIALRRVRNQGNDFEQLFWSGHPLEQLYEECSRSAAHPMEALFVVGMREWREIRGRAESAASWDAVERHMEKAMSVSLAREVEPLRKHLLSLATIGSTAPFVGLFGTVWGIMNSFRAIALSSDTSLAVVAPGIAEALFATALGLFVAIPAVVFYNRFNEAVNAYGEQLEIFCDEFTAFLFREEARG